MVLKGSYIAPNKSQQSGAQEKRAESSKTGLGGDAGAEIKAKPGHISHLTLDRHAAR